MSPRLRALIPAGMVIHPFVHIATFGLDDLLLVVGAVVLFIITGVKNVPSR